PIHRLASFFGCVRVDCEGADDSALMYDRAYTHNEDDQAQLVAVSDLKTRRGSRQKSSVESFSRRLRFAGRDQRKRTLTDHTVSAQSRRRLIDVTDHVRRVYDSKHVGCAGR